MEVLFDMCIENQHLIVLEKAIILFTEFFVIFLGAQACLSR